MVGAEAAQVDGLGARRKVGGVARLLRLGFTRILADGFEHVRHAGIAAGADLIRGDGGDGCRAFLARTRDARAKDGDDLAVIGHGGSGCRCRRVLCKGGGRQAQQAYARQHREFENAVQPVRHAQLLVAV